MTTTAASSTSNRIPGLEVVRKIGAGAQAEVFLVRRGTAEYALKVFRTGSIVSLRREARTLAQINHACIPKVMDVGELQGSPYIVMEYVDGESLAARLRRGPLAEQELVPLATILAEGLAAVHSLGQLHRDIKPDNILIDRRGVPKLTDFGLAGAIEANADGGRTFVGSAAYVSPESAGMVKRPEDGRSDLYSLGVVLFEASTGRRPFVGDDVAELLRMHAAVVPPDPRTLNPAISAGLSAIIQRLLAKDPDARYPTSLSLVEDLRRVEQLSQQIAARGGEAVFQDGGDRVGLDLPLVGRHAERDALQKAWANLKKRSGSAILVEGEAGTGKSRLIRELLPLAHQSSAIVLTAKMSEGDPLPLAPLRQAFDGRLQRLRWLPRAQREAFEKKLREAAGAAAPEVAMLSPLLAQALGVSASTQAAPENLREFLATFIVRFAEMAGPVLFILDDVQWLDESSRAVLAQVSRRVSDVPLLFAFTSRTEQESGEGYQAFLASMGSRLAAHMHLKPLDREGADELVAVHLGGSKLDPASVDRIFTRSQGNPFVLVQYVHAMLEEGALRPSWGQWVVDAAAMDKLALTSDVGALLNRRVEAIGASAREILSVAALIGSRFHGDLLSQVAGAAQSAVEASLAEAVRASLVEPVLDGGYAFVHDKIRESLLQRLDEARQRDLHLVIADALERQGGDSAEQAVSIAFHLSRAHDDRDPARLFRVTREAARALQRQSAHEEALSYLETAETAAGRAGQPLDAAFYATLALSLERTRRFRESLTAISKALELETDQERRTDLVVRDTYIRSASDELTEWDLLEKEMTASKTPGLWGRNLALMFFSMLPWFFLGLIVLKTRIGYGTARGKTRDRLQNALRLYETGSWVAYHKADPLRYVAVTARMTYAAARVGACTESAIGLASIAMLASQFNLKTLQNFCTRQVEDMWQTTGDRELVSAVVWANTITVLLSPRGDPVEFAARTESELHKNGPWMQGGRWKNLVDALQLSYALRGMHHDVLRWDEEVQQRGGGRSFAIMSLAATGRATEAEQVFQESKAYVQAQPRHEICRGLFSSATMSYYYFSRRKDADEAEEIAAIYDSLKVDPKFALYPFAFFYISRSYLLLDACVSAEGAARAAALAKLKKTVGDFSKMPPFDLLHAHLRTLQAGVAWVEGRTDDALKLLRQAETLADRLSVAWAHFEIARLRARIDAAAGRGASVGIHVVQAAALANQYGWVTLLQALIDEFGEIARPLVTSSPATGSSGSTTRTRSTKTQRSSSTFAEAVQGRKLDALMSVSRACASVVNADELCNVAVEEALKILGAERACLFVADPNTKELVLRAKAEGERASGTHSRTIVNRVWASRAGLVSTASEEGNVLTSESAVAQGLRSVIAAPLVLQESALGVIYLDSSLVSGLFTGDDLDILQAIATQVAAALETAQVATLQAQRAALEKDLALTGAVQSLLLPSETTMEVGALALAGFSKPADKSGGDWWWSGRTDDGRMLVFVGDVTGHGAGSAMVTATFAGLFHALRHAQKGAVDGWLLEMSKLYARLCGARYNLAFTMVELDPASGRFRYWAGGLPPSLVLRKATGRVDVVSLSGGPFSATPHEKIESTEGALAEGDRMFIFTDGIPEAERRGRQIGLKGASQILTQAKDKDLAAAREHVIEAARDLMQDWKTQGDDVTFVLVENR